MRPAPNRPSVRPLSSIPSNSSGCQPAHWPLFTSPTPSRTRRAHARINAQVRSAVASVRTSGVFVDRKSTRLNSSHSQISYAVFCLKKKKNHIESPPDPTNRLTYYYDADLHCSCVVGEL